MQATAYDQERVSEAVALAKVGRYAEAEPLYVAHLAKFPNDYLALHNLGVVYLSRSRKFGKDWQLAFDLFSKVTLEPHEDFVTKSSSMNNLGLIMLGCGAESEAAICFATAARWDPGSPGAKINLGDALMRDLKFGAAHHELAEALRLDPDSAKAKFNRGYCLLAMGVMEEGWKGYESRWHVNNPEMIEFQTSKPRWDGSEFPGKTVLICGEQGFGDSIMFIRYAKLIKERGGRVHWYGHAPLNDLFVGVEGIDKIWTERPTEDQYDFWLHLLSAPMLFKTRLNTIPAEVPYIRTAPHFTVLHKMLDAEKMLPHRRIGLCWAGSPAHGKDRHRSFPPETFQPLIDAFPGCGFYSLQCGPRENEVERLKGVTDLRPFVKSWSDTAQLLQQLDLLISCDTALVHLAGALARPVWMLAPFSPDWRWMLERTDSPWYPTMRLFRQDQRKDYAALVREQIIPALNEPCSKS